MDRLNRRNDIRLKISIISPPIKQKNLNIYGRRMSPPRIVYYVV
jgi:hypothetical protein